MGFQKHDWTQWGNCNNKLLAQIKILEGGEWGRKVDFMKVESEDPETFKKILGILKSYGFHE